MLGLDIQLASDVHVETRRRWPHVIPAAPYLALCGDIGTPRKPTYLEFLRETCPHFKRVLLLAGNHEFYGGPVEETLEMIRETLAAFPNVEFLDNTATSLETPSGRSVRVLGSTLWADPPPAAADLNDFRRIWVDAPMRRRFSMADMRARHRVCVSWLDTELAKVPDPTLVLTHHAPLPEFNGPFIGAPAAAAFASDLDLHRKHPHVVGWFCGHVHQNMVFKRDGCLFASNCTGYPGERVHGYRNPLVLHL